VAVFYQFGEIVDGNDIVNVPIVKISGITLELKAKLLHYQNLSKFLSDAVIRSAFFMEPWFYKSEIAQNSAA
jgi:hypothetical protein